jgi:hypothetical protein
MVSAVERYISNKYIFHVSNFELLQQQSVKAIQILANLVFSE